MDKIILSISVLTTISFSFGYCFLLKKLTRDSDINRIKLEKRFIITTILLVGSVLCTSYFLRINFM